MGTRLPGTHISTTQEGRASRASLVRLLGVWHHYSGRAADSAQRLQPSPPAMSSPWSARRAPSTRRAAPASTRAAGPPLRWTALLPAAAVATAAALVAAGIASAPPVVFEAVQRRYFSQQRPWLSSAHLRASHLDIAALEHAQRLVFCSSGDEDRIYTGDMALDGSAEAHACIAIEGRHVVAIGSPRSVQADGCKKQQHNSSQTVDGRSGHRQCSFHQLAPGHSILPGLHDAHGHVLDLGWARSAVDLVGATSTQGEPSG